MKKNEIKEDNRTFKQKVIDWIFSITVGAVGVAALLGSEKCFEDLAEYQENDYKKFYSNNEEEIEEKYKKYKKDKAVTAIMRPVCYWSVITTVIGLGSVIYATLFCKEDEEE